MARRILEQGASGFLKKPFNLNQLSQKVREILDPQAGDEKNMALAN
jgi:DNA-binding response OmpR family regulator